MFHWGTTHQANMGGGFHVVHATRLMGGGLRVVLCHSLFSAWQILFFECNHQVKVYTFNFLYPHVHTLVWSLACLSHQASGRRVLCGPCHEASGRRVPCGPCHQASGRRVPCGPCHQVTQFCLSCTHWQSRVSKHKWLWLYCLYGCAVPT